MKSKIGFKLDWLEMILVLAIIFLTGIIATRQMDDRFTYVSLLLLAAGRLLLNKRVKILTNKD